MARGEFRFKVVLALAAIFGLRMLGLFMVIPVISLYAYQLPHSSASLAGMALGIYGLTQACLQLPFGMLSDKFGRKKVIYFGLLLFALGSIVAANAHDVYQLVIGRALQGAGAIGSTLIATVADFTSEKHRTRAMALIGMTIGCSFMLGFLIGPLLSYHYGVPSLFWVTAGFALFGMLLCLILIPDSGKIQIHADSEALLELIPMVLKNKSLVRLDLGILFQHMILTANFTVLPFLFKNELAISRAQQWQIYGPVLIGTFLLSVPIIILAEKRNLLKPTFLGMIALTCFSQLMLYTSHLNLQGIVLGLTFYFIPFNVLEATLPSMISKTAPASAKGTAMGVYSTSQFFGIFLGGAIAGLLMGMHHIGMVFSFTTFIAIVWFLSAFGMQAPPRSRSYQLDYKSGSLGQSEVKNVLKQYAGILDIAILPNESAVYIKVDKHKFDETQLENIKTRLTT